MSGPAVKLTYFIQASRPLTSSLLASSLLASSLLTSFLSLVTFVRHFELANLGPSPQIPSQLDWGSIHWIWSQLAPSSPFAP